MKQPTTMAIRVKVWGDFACFTRPDLKVERMSYPCMTPAAARGVLEAILRKPEFVWHIRSIAILNPVRFFSIRRNEVAKKASGKPIIVEDDRVMRNSIVLRDVAYVIEADIVVPEPTGTNHAIKYMAMFNKRVAKGQCYKRPYLGTREFWADFGPAEKTYSPIAENLPIGGMLLDIFYDAEGNPQPHFFAAVIRNGILDCNEDYRVMLDSSHIKPVDLDHPPEAQAILQGWNLDEEQEMLQEASS